MVVNNHKNEYWKEYAEIHSLLPEDFEVGTVS